MRRVLCALGVAGTLAAGGCCCDPCGCGHGSGCHGGESDTIAEGVGTEDEGGESRAQSDRLDVEDGYGSGAACKLACDRHVECQPDAFDLEVCVAQCTGDAGQAQVSGPACLDAFVQLQLCVAGLDCDALDVFLAGTVKGPCQAELAAQQQAC